MTMLGCKVILGFWILTGFPIVIFCLEIVAAAFFRKSELKIKAGDHHSTVGILIPAHNEEKGLEYTLRNIACQLRPGDRLLVVADNCTDETAVVAARMGAEVIKRQSTLRGKGYALDHGIRYFANNPPDVLLIVDADCCLAPGSIEALASCCVNSNGPAQALNLMKAPDHANPSVKLSEFIWRIKNWVRPLGLSHLNFPCQLTGTGMAFPWAVIRLANLANGEIVEDLKLGLEMTKIGKGPTFCPDATVVSYFPTSTKGARTQRERWEMGHVAMIMSLGPQMLWDALKSRNFNLLILTLDLSVPPISTIVLLQAVLFISAVILSCFGAPITNLYLIGITLSALTFAVLLSWAKFGQDVVQFRTVLSLPFHVIKKANFYRVAFSRFSTPREWVRTDRGDRSDP